VDFPLYIVADVVVISTRKAATLARNGARVSCDSFAIEGINEVEEEPPLLPIAFSSPEDPWGHRATRRS
jgi:hypothetical protein